VLANRLKITDPDEMADIELELLEQLYEHEFSSPPPDRGLTVADLETWHHRWLGNVYNWAGETRSVNVSKSGFQFASADQVHRLLDEYQTGVLDQRTPCQAMNINSLIESLAIAHVELVLIHPFREGNGRLARFLADVMSVQAGFGLLDYTAWDLQKQQYFSAIQRGMDRDYSAMQVLFRAVLDP
jgi:cell filamentation protein